MSKITVITTFSENGYNLYGKRWINSVIKNWPQNVNVVIYTDFLLDPPAENFQIKNFNQEFPEHENFKIDVFKNFGDGDKFVSIKNKTIKFSYKGFVISKELNNVDDGYLIWLDGDTETIKHIPNDLIANILNNKFLACQQEKNYRHVESGILIFDMSNDISKKFGKDLTDYYFNKKLFNLKKPYDGYIIADILKNKKYDHTDLNSNFNFQDKKSKKEDTFLHPLLKEHFVHWIGNTKV